MRRIGLPGLILLLVQQAVAPPDRRLQRPLARLRAAVTRAQHRQLTGQAAVQLEGLASEQAPAGRVTFATMEVHNGSRTRQGCV